MGRRIQVVSHLSNMLLAGVVKYNPFNPNIPLNSNDVFFSFLQHCSHFCYMQKTRELFIKADVWGFGNFVKGSVKRKHGWFSALTEEVAFH